MDYDDGRVMAARAAAIKARMDLRTPAKERRTHDKHAGGYAVPTDAEKRVQFSKRKRVAKLARRNRKNNGGGK